MDEWSMPHYGRFSPETPGIHCTLGETEGRSGNVRKMLRAQIFDPRTVQPITV
jgi:hypothetical protein